MHSPTDTDLLASLASANGGELSDRVPCRVTPLGGLELSRDVLAQDGVADTVAFWCPDCGEFKGFRVLPHYLCFERGVLTLIKRPMLPLGEEDEWGRA